MVGKFPMGISQMQYNSSGCRKSTNETESIFDKFWWKKSNLRYDVWVKHRFRRDLLLVLINEWLLQRCYAPHVLKLFRRIHVKIEMVCRCICYFLIPSNSIHATCAVCVNWLILINTFHSTFRVYNFQTTNCTLSSSTEIYIFCTTIQRSTMRQSSIRLKRPTIFMFFIRIIPR